MADQINEPINPIQAFTQDGEASLASQITFYMLLGALFGEGRASVRRDAERVREQFPLPEVKERFRLDLNEYLNTFSERYALPDPRVPSAEWGEDEEINARRRNISNDLVNKIYHQPSADSVADLILLGINDSNEFISVASAISFVDIFDNIALAVSRLIQIIDEHFDELAGVIAQTALMRLGVQHFMSSLGDGRSEATGAPRSSTLLIHGSNFGFVGSKIGDWWKPGGNFHSYIKTNHCHNLYSKPDFYTWSGGWSDHARQLAAVDLRDWANKRKLGKIDILAHSHGGNVVMWATQLGLEINNLILLSCPEHLNYYQPEFSRVANVVSYQIQLDWVILADGGGIYFNDPRIDDRVQNKWFRQHTDTHDPAFWQAYGLSI